MKLTLFKKYQKLFTSHIFSSCVQCVQLFEFELKNNDTISMVSEIQTMRKLNNPTTFISFSRSQQEVFPIFKQLNFHDGGCYHIETSPLILITASINERVNLTDKL